MSSPITRKTAVSLLHADDEWLDAQSARLLAYVRMKKLFTGRSFAIRLLIEDARSRGLDLVDVLLRMPADAQQAHDDDE
jgi:hypothetical protein